MADPLFLYKLKNGLLGTPDNYGGMLSEDQTRAAQNTGMMNFGAALLQASGPSREPTSLGQALGSALLAGQQGKSQNAQQQLNALLLQKQIAAASRNSQPSDVQSFEYFDKLRRENPEAYKAWLETQNKQNVPSSLLEVKALQENPALLDQLQRISAAKIGAPYTPSEVAGAKGGFDKRNSSFNPMSTSQQEIAFSSDKTRAESESKAKGTGAGEIWTDFQKKGAKAETINSVLDMADPLIDIATGSAGGAAVDKVASFFGSAPDGAKAIGSLKVLQAGLMLNQPRMEGPQSDADTILYKEAAASIGDPTVPREIKKAALGTIRQLQEKYKQNAAVSNGGQPKVRRYNPTTGKIE